MRFLAVVPLALAAIAACSTKGSSTTPTPDVEAGAVRPDDATAEGMRGRCGYARGALAKDTLGASAPIGKDIPVDTIVVVIQENRSFDHYFAHLAKYAGRSDIDGAPDSATNPDTIGTAPGASHPFQHASHLCTLDTNHEWYGTHMEWDDGKLDGFYQQNNGYTPLPPDGGAALQSGERALWWYDERDIPFYYDLAKTFGIGDRYFAPVLGPTWPNRMYAYAATSFGRTSNDFPNLAGFSYPQNDAVIFDTLEKAGVSWAVVNETLPGPAIVVGLGIATRWGRNPIMNIADFKAKAAAGTLPQVVFYESHIGQEGPAKDDEHPPADVQVGQKAMSDVVHALFGSPQWPHLALFITYDEHGGFYDHVPPPAACAPDTTAPIVGATDPIVGTFAQYGVRVPLMVVSPFAKKGYTSHVTSDHTSILRFIQARFELPALTKRDANASALLDYFDFQHPPFLTPPTLKEPTVDQAELDYCETTFRK